MTYYYGNAPWILLKKDSLLSTCIDRLMKCQIIGWSCLSNKNDSNVRFRRQTYGSCWCVNWWIRPNHYHTLYLIFDFSTFFAILNCPTVLVTFVIWTVRDSLTGLVLFLDDGNYQFNLDPPWKMWNTFGNWRTVGYFNYAMSVIIENAMVMRKGKITDILQKNDFVVRYQGGNNAGHTVVVGETPSFI